MPDSLSLSPVERKAAADRLWKIIAMCDDGASVSDIREAIRYTAHALDHPEWDGLANKPTNLEKAA